MILVFSVKLLIIKQMNEQSQNITLEDINLANSREVQTISDLSSIHYEEKYQYLGRNDNDKEHFLMKNIKLTPQKKEYHVRFYQQLEFDPADSAQKADEKMIYRQKIGTVTIKPRKDQQTLIRLPLVKKPIAIEVKTEDTMNGYLSMSEALQQQASLYNKKGENVGILSYQVQHMAGMPSLQQNSRLVPSLNQTLHSKDFEHQYLNEPNQSIMITKINQQLKKTLDHIEQDEINQRETDKVFEDGAARRKRKPVDGQTSEVESSGSEGQERRKVESRVASFRIPIATQEKQPVQFEIDWNSIRRCKEQLGLSHIDIESMLMPRTKNNQEKSQSINKTNPEIEESNHNLLEQIYQENFIQRKQLKKEYANRQKYPQKDDLSSSSQKEELGRQEERSLKRDIVKGFRSIGVETYTPLPSLKTTIHSSQVQLRSKTLKSPSQSSSIAQRNKSVSQSSPKKQLLNPLKLRSEELAIKIQNQLLRSSPNNQVKRLHKHSEVFSIHINQTGFKVPDLPPIPISQLDQRPKPKPKTWESCLDTPINKASCSEAESQNASTQQYEVSINNISLQLDKIIPGYKYLDLSQGQNHQSTSQLLGNSLIWTGTHYRFQGTTQDSITITVKGQGINKISKYGKVKVRIVDLLKNKRQSYYQGLVLNQKEVIGNIIIGYNFAPTTQIVNRYLFPRQNTSITQSYTEMKREKHTKRQEATDRLEQVQNRSQKRKKMLSPKQNPIKMRKYLGGKNIKIGRASRFGLNMKAFKPGPGDYEIESEFSRHAVKQF